MHASIQLLRHNDPSGITKVLATNDVLVRNAKVPESKYIWRVLKQSSLAVASGSHCWSPRAEARAPRNAAVPDPIDGLPQVTVVCLVKPGCFREVHSFIQTAKGGGGRIDVVALAATEDGDGSTEFEASAAGFAERLQISANREQAARCAHKSSVTCTPPHTPEYLTQ